MASSKCVADEWSSLILMIKKYWWASVAYILSTAHAYFCPIVKGIGAQCSGVKVLPATSANKRKICFGHGHVLSLLCQGLLV